MKRLLISIIAILILALSALPAAAQDGAPDEPKPNKDLPKIHVRCGVPTPPVGTFESVSIEPPDLTGGKINPKCVPTEGKWSLVDRNDPNGPTLVEDVPGASSSDGTFHALQVGSKYAGFFNNFVTSPSSGVLTTVTADRFWGLASSGPRIVYQRMFPSTFSCILGGPQHQRQPNGSTGHWATFVTLSGLCGSPRFVYSAGMNSAWWSRYGTIWDGRESYHQAITRVGGCDRGLLYDFIAGGWVYVTAPICGTGSYSYGEVYVTLQGNDGVWPLYPGRELVTNNGWVLAGDASAWITIPSDSLMQTIMDDPPFRWMCNGNPYQTHYGRWGGPPQPYPGTFYNGTAFWDNC